MNYALPDFDTLLELHKNDIKALDQIKKETTEAFISKVSEKSQRRLRGLQFQIDMELRRSKSPMDGCIKLSNMMHESLAELRSHLNAAFDTDLADSGELNFDTAEQKSARILPFSTCR
ncbi:MAG: DUF3135 domain-containing protein [Pseudomonadales bacterium]|nr:DUF3135 domain-containing protein [Pseudomonadales bacterium]